jgi:predicted acyl esterase
MPVADSTPAPDMKPLDPAARPSPEFDVHLTENVMVPMRDGVRIPKTSLGLDQGSDR